MFKVFALTNVLIRLASDQMTCKVGLAFGYISGSLHCIGRVLQIVHVLG